MHRAAIILVLVTAALWGATVAVAQAPVLGARLAACESGIDRADRFAVFSGAMPRQGAVAMAMRFDLYEKLPGERFRRVVLDKWGVWEQTSKKGVPGFVFTKRVEELAAPAAFRAVVRFRWYDANGHVVDAARRTTRRCRQPDWRPDLHVQRVVLPADGGPTKVVVRNDGRGPAGPFGVEVTRSDVVRNATVGGLPAGERATAALPVGRCTPGETVTVTLDRPDAVDEADEADNTSTVTCPAPSGPRRPRR